MGDGTFIGVASSTLAYLEAYTSIMNLDKGPGDEGPNIFHAAKGDSSRQQLYGEFLKSDCDWCLFLDADMVFPKDLIPRLKAHGKEFVGALYFRRQTDPMWPLAYEYQEPPVLPFVPWFQYPNEGLHRANAIGSGCWMIHRDAFPAIEREMLDTTERLLGYRLKSIPLIMDGPVPEVLGDYRRLGADLRFCYYARRAGLDIWLDCDPGLDIGHILHYPLGRKDYEAQEWSDVTRWSSAYRAIAEVYQEQGMDRHAIEVRIQQYEAQFKEVQRQGELKQQEIKTLEKQAHIIAGKIAAMKELLEAEGEPSQELEAKNE